MKHNYLNNTPLNEAKKLFFEAASECGFSGGRETVGTAEALGRTLDRAVYAAISSPHYNASAMDGIAVRSADTFGASEKEPAVLRKEQYEVVDTGDPLPDGKDAVIMAEDVINDTDGIVKLYSAASPWQHVRQVGEDICMGDMIAPSNTVVTPALIGAFLAGGVTEIPVKRRPVFGIIPTGDEIVPPTSVPKKGEIIESNSSIFSAMLQGWGAESRVYGIVKDKKELIRSALEKALDECDAVLILAGSSAGRDDYTSEIVGSLGKIVVHGVAVKPGKPAVLGTAKSKPVVGLPGYPVSAVIIMEEFVRDLVEKWFGRKIEEYNDVKATLGTRINSSLKYREYVRVSLGSIDGELNATPISGGAGVITGLTKADGLLIIDQNSEGFEKGSEVDIRLLRELSEIENSLVVTGSHDPIIDELSDLVQRAGLGFRVKSSHVGSMGAIAAVKAGRAHMGAIHLLDEESGEYNTSYVEKYFSDGSAVLKKGIRRIQGLMVPKGNPLNIQKVSDLVRCRFVNRQRGAGTRVLLDYLLKKEGISPDRIDGYRNEKFTHTAVAAFVASGDADAGLGIYSAAKIYGLDFIPLCDEEYDFLVSAKYAGHPFVKAFFELFESDEFKERIERMGGYRLWN